jgi:geranylgeranyl diphosphate synthase, type II
LITIIRKEFVMESPHYFLEQCQYRIREKIEKKVMKFTGKGILKEACAYTLLNGGKRFRPALVLMIADTLNQGIDVSAPAFAVECFHTASLVADDLPCMDDDDERRNKPTAHKLYGEMIALLASYALIAEGYGAIAEGGHSFTQAKPERSQDSAQIVAMALENAAFNTGLSGATGGQFLDMLPPDLSEATIREVIHKKTTSLFEIAFVFGWLFGGGDFAKLSLVKQCACHFGMAFQVADDIGDVEQDAQKGRKINMAGAFGMERAQYVLEEELAGYRKLLRELNLNSPALMGLSDLLLSL